MADNVHFLTRNSATRTETSPRKSSAGETVPAKDPIDLQQQRELRASSDQISLTHTAKSASSTNQLAAQLSGVDMEKVEMIKRAIAEGRYPLDPDAIAERMLNLADLIDPPPGIKR